MTNKLLLIILDGWGIAQNPKVSAIDHAHTPFMHHLLDTYPHSHLTTHGLDVGLPEGQMGNSEVGHMNIGAGRIVYQDLVKINLAIKNKTLEKEEALINCIQYAKTSGKKVHLMGLVSDGGVHAHIDHCIGIMDIFKNAGIQNIFIHAFTDGRDTDPKSGLGFLQKLEAHAKLSGAKIATVTGRYYAMDRDNRWERVKMAYDAMVHGVGTQAQSLSEAITQSYTQGITDEFIKPIILEKEGLIAPHDVVFCFNFRTDRGREITMALSQKSFPELQMEPLALHYITMTNYDDTFKNINVVYPKDNLNNTLGEVLSKEGKKQIRIAETEKYPHVTFFFSGGREKEFEGETRILCPSPKVATYDLKPEMSAFDIKNAIIPELTKAEADFICLNFANADMVGHTGDFQAAVKACEAVDICNKAVVETALGAGYTVLVTADHGNSDYMINEDGTPNTAHTTNLVPFIVAGNYKGKVKHGKLGDIAPTILKLMRLEKPLEMTGNCLVD